MTETKTIDTRAIVAAMFNRDELQDASNAARMIGMIDAAPTSFIYIKGYTTKGTGETQDVLCIKGANYGNTVAKSIAELTAMEGDADFSVVVKYNEWVKPDGTLTTAACKTKTLRKVELTLSAGDSILAEGFAKVRQGLENPRDPTVSYEKKGHGVYGLGEALYLRDCRFISKTVVSEGEHKIKTQKQATAVGDAIRRKLAIGNYRAYKLDARYESISIGGEKILPPELREAVEVEGEAKTEEVVSQ